MDSPIDPRIWKYMFHGTVGFFAIRIALSLYNERRINLSVIDEEVRALKRCPSNESPVPILQAILEQLNQEQRSKKGNVRLALYNSVSTLLKAAKFNEDKSNGESVELAIKIIERVFGGDAEGKQKLYQANGFQVLLTALGEAHRSGLRRVMEVAAAALQNVTELDDAEIVLPFDVPSGAEGAAQLAQSKTLSTMLKILDPATPIVYLNALTGLYANVTALKCGATSIGKGYDKKEGIEYFLPLLDHGNGGIVENAAETVRHLVRSGVGHKALLVAENANRVASLVDVNRDPKIVSAMLTVVLAMLDGDVRPEFLQVMGKTDLFPSLFMVWCRHREKMIRDRAEVLIHLLSRSEAHLIIRALLEENRSKIMERKSKDEEERRKQMQQMKQQQMMQQMMMQQMGMGGGGGMEGGMDF